jgi:hypothetical protein
MGRVASACAEMKNGVPLFETSSIHCLFFSHGTFGVSPTQSASAANVKPVVHFLF